MKRLWFIAAACALTIAFSACSSEDPATTAEAVGPGSGGSTGGSTPPPPPPLPPPPPPSPSVTAGNEHVCLLRPDGQVKCWGNGFYGKLGTGNTANVGDAANQMGSNLPFVALGTGRTALALAAGNDHTCAVLDDHSLKCWGEASFGQLGLGDFNNRGDVPAEMGNSLPAVNVGTGALVTAVSGGAFHTCALLNTGNIKCWGSNGNGQLGLGDTAGRGGSPASMGNALPPVNLGTGRTAIAVAAGSFHTCALLDNGTVKCWGNNGWGQLGQGDATQRGDTPASMGDALAPVNLGTGRTAIAIGAGYQFACALLDNLTVKCWGENGNGQLGQGTTNTAVGDAAAEMGDSLPAVNVGTGRSAMKLFVGLYNACALLDNNALKCWGWNTYGQLGLGDTTDRGKFTADMGDSLPPVDLGTGRSATQLSTRWGNTCAVLNDDTLKCWGRNANGQLGQGDTLGRGGGPNQMGDLLPVVNTGP